MFTFLAQQLDSSKIVRYQFQQNQSKLSWQQVITYWKTNPDFQLFYSETLANCPFPAFFWEHPPIIRSRLEQAYEFVLVESHSLARVKADATAFSQQFRQESPVCTFSNLGGDAKLIVPKPLTPALDYAHLAVFARKAPSEQQQALWQLLSNTLHTHLSETLIWLSTSGLGVYWLHLRLDSRPKYYTYHPYRNG